MSSAEEELQPGLCDATAPRGQGEESPWVGCWGWWWVGLGVWVFGLIRLG